jgi:hypothetical protein
MAELPVRKYATIHEAELICVFKAVASAGERDSAADMLGYAMRSPRQIAALVTLQRIPMRKSVMKPLGRGRDPAPIADDACSSRSISRYDPVRHLDRLQQIGRRARTMVGVERSADTETAAR